MFASAERHCELCALVGRENADSHSLAYCYANPQNKEHKPWRVRARYRDIIKAGLEMPECMKEYAASQEDDEKPGEPSKPAGTAAKKEQIKKQMASFGEDLQQFCGEGMTF